MSLCGQLFDAIRLKNIALLEFADTCIENRKKEFEREKELYKEQKCPHERAIPLNETLNAQAFNHANKTAIMVAAEEGWAVGIQFLLSKKEEILVNGIKELKPKVELTVHLATFQTPLHFAVLSGNKECCELLFKADPQQIHVQDQHGQTPLLMAINNDQVECARFLCEQLKIQPTLETKQTSKPVDAKQNASQVLVRKPTLIINKSGKAEVSPLCAAASRQQFSLIKDLLEAKADVTACHPFYQLSTEIKRDSGNSKQRSSGSLEIYYHCSVLHLLLYKPVKPIRVADLTIAVKSALGHGAEVNCFDKTDDSSEANDIQTPLHLATRYASSEIVEELLKRKANPCEPIRGKITQGGNLLYPITIAVIIKGDEQEQLKKVQLIWAWMKQVNIKTNADYRVLIFNFEFNENFAPLQELAAIAARNCRPLVLEELIKINKKLLQSKFSEEISKQLMFEVLTRENPYIAQKLGNKESLEEKIEEAKKVASFEASRYKTLKILIEQFNFPVNPQLLFEVLTQKNITEEYRYKTLELLLANFKSPIDVVDANGNTLLHVASLKKNYKAMVLILDAAIKQGKIALLEEKNYQDQAVALYQTVSEKLKTDISTEQKTKPVSSPKSDSPKAKSLEVKNPNEFLKWSVYVLNKTNPREGFGNKLKQTIRNSVFGDQVEKQRNSVYVQVVTALYDYYKTAKDGIPNDELLVKAICGLYWGMINPWGVTSGTWNSKEASGFYTRLLQMSVEKLIQQFENFIDLLNPKEIKIDNPHLKQFVESAENSDIAIRQRLIAVFGLKLEKWVGDKTVNGAQISTQVLDPTVKQSGGKMQSDQKDSGSTDNPKRSAESKDNAATPTETPAGQKQPEPVKKDSQSSYTELAKVGLGPNSADTLKPNVDPSGSIGQFSVPASSSNGVLQSMVAAELPTRSSDPGDVREKTSDKIQVAHYSM